MACNYFFFSLFLLFSFSSSCFSIIARLPTFSFRLASCLNLCPSFGLIFLPSFLFCRDTEKQFSMKRSSTWVQRIDFALEEPSVPLAAAELNSALQDVVLRRDLLQPLYSRFPEIISVVLNTDERSCVLSCCFLVLRCSILFGVLLFCLFLLLLSGWFVEDDASVWDLLCPGKAGSLFDIIFTHAALSPPVSLPSTQLPVSGFHTFVS